MQRPWSVSYSSTCICISGCEGNAIYFKQVSLLCVDLVTCTINALLKYFKLNHLKYFTYLTRVEFHQLHVVSLIRSVLHPLSQLNTDIYRQFSGRIFSLSLSLSLSGTMPGIHGENQWSSKFGEKDHLSITPCGSYRIYCSVYYKFIQHHIKVDTGKLCVKCALKVSENQKVDQKAKLD